VTNLTDLTLADARDGIQRKAFSAVELTQAHLDAMAGARSLNAFIRETPDQALAMAKASDERIARAEGGPLEGLPLGIKDLFCTTGVVTTAGSNILKSFEPAYESAITQNLWRDGAVMLGKLNLDEFAMGSSNETSAYGPVVSPWRRPGSDAPLVPGGSSGGSASAVAARLCLAATATDTGGSIRQPAAFTGTVGIKPTYGRCSRWGTVAFASSLDQAGPIARTVRDAAIMLRSMSGHDPRDTTSVDVPVPDFEAAVSRGVKGLKIGIPRNTGSTACRPRSRPCGGRASNGSGTPGPRWWTCRCPTPSMRCPPITSSPRRRPPRTSPAMTASATAFAFRGGTSAPSTRTPARQASAAR
jgi:aspartyl-tRNA(Asn)/glutamyl-tRNA(Gln) amidotransferase subunit A